MRRMQHGSKPSLRMVYEAFLRAGADIRPSVELAERLSLPERIPTPPAQRLAEPERIPTPPAERPPLKSLKPSEVIQLETVYAMDIIDLLMQVLPDHEPLDVPWFECFSYFEPADLHSDYMEREAAKGKGAFIQALWSEYAKPKLYRLVYKAWRQHGAQTLTTWTQLAEAVLDGCFGQEWPDSVFQVPDACPICLSTMHWPEKTHCGHAFHIRCLLRHLDVRNTCPLCRAPNPLRASNP
ncbi:hypothetical protein TNIN_321191 [Trichonephila inaurata madagascariensis]|uniref:RING-type domain-containing protein n=1 Tax=Trichonephila inaurata madagascariensis TaxID=2747483 RepID=A0A8X6JA38_9ARAC|nr:hypothetical protein TNIN_321191 [Trichonephila inaurata madagascariensis]